MYRLTNDNAVAFFKVAAEHEMKLLMNHVATFLQDRRPNRDWPFELLVMIFDLDQERKRQLVRERDEERARRRSLEEQMNRIDDELIEFEDMDHGHAIFVEGIEVVHGLQDDDEHLLDGDELNED